MRSDSGQHRGRYLIGMRSDSGQHLIEMMVAIAVSGFLAAVLGTSLGQTIATSTAAENRLKSADIAQELIERIRDEPYSFPLPTNGTYAVPVYSDDGVVSGVQPFQQQPLLMDLNNYAWSAAAKANRLKGPSPNGFATASATFAPGPSTTSIAVSVTVSWAEQTAQRSTTISTLVSQYGMHD